MKSRFVKTLSSSVTTIVLLLLYALGLSVATFVEKYQGTAVAQSLFYHSALFIFLQALLVANFLAVILRHRWLRKGRWGFMLTHLALIIILTGAFTTFLFSQDGTMHLREGETSNQIFVRTERGKTVHTLPFSVELKNFTLTRYPGSSSPSSFESEVVVHVDGEECAERIYMNNVLDVKGYRFFQASYDSDECGTVFTVSSDVAGRRITYAGYALLLLGFVLCLFGRDSRFMRLKSRLRELWNTANAICLLLLVVGNPFSVAAKTD
ncbi:MAG: cytochrome c biogenesis protein ResB, partial [Bacteroidaceae bacterium]|nr:cytochrome c biogenesis protein ResB [Bacteroidaceae bacterium]